MAFGQRTGGGDVDERVARRLRVHDGHERRPQGHARARTRRAPTSGGAAAPRGGRRGRLAGSPGCPWFGHVVRWLRVEYVLRLVSAATFAAGPRIGAALVSATPAAPSRPRDTLAASMGTGADQQRGILVSGRFPELEAALVERVRELRAGRPLAPLTVVVGSSAVRTRVGDVLVRRLGAVANVSVLTLAQFARRLATEARGAPPVQLAGLTRERLLRRLVSEHAGRGFAYFGPVADRPHFPLALASTFADLRQALVAPDTAWAARGPGASSDGREGRGPRGAVRGLLRRTRPPRPCRRRAACTWTRPGGCARSRAGKAGTERDARGPRRRRRSSSTASTTSTRLRKELVGRAAGRRRGRLRTGAARRPGRGRARD